MLLLPLAALRLCALAFDLCVAGVQDRAAERIQVKSPSYRESGCGIGEAEFDMSERSSNPDEVRERKSSVLVRVFKVVGAALKLIFSFCLFSIFGVGLDEMALPFRFEV